MTNICLDFQPGDRVHHQAIDMRATVADDANATSDSVAIIYDHAGSQVWYVEPRWLTLLVREDA